MFDNAELIKANNKSKAAFINNTDIIILAFCSVFYIRIFCTLTPAPSVLNHAHLVIVPLATLMVVATSRSQEPKQNSLVLALTIALGIFFTAVVSSAFWNEAGLVNAIASFMLLAEPFIFLIAIVCIPMTLKSFNKLRKWLILSVVINFALAAIQKPLIDANLLYAEGFNGTDGCGGVFFVSGAGNYVSASVTVAFVLYFLFNYKKYPLWVRLGAIAAAVWQVLFSDSKQLVLAYAVAWILLILINSTDIGKSLKLLIGMMLVSLVSLWCFQNVEAFSAFGSWARPELYERDGEAWYAKFYSARIILAEFRSPFNWLFGLGPGHTVSRLGAWFLRDYASLLEPLGATTRFIGVDAREFVDGFWLTKGSSVFSPIFGWAGVWGDLGLLGLGTYLYMSFVVWQNFALDNSLKITMLSILVMGFIFTQVEEPGYMVSIAMIIGLAWQEKRLKFKQKGISRAI